MRRRPQQQGCVSGPVWFAGGAVEELAQPFGYHPRLGPDGYILRHFLQILTFRLSPFVNQYQLQAAVLAAAVRLRRRFQLQITVSQHPGAAEDMVDETEDRPLAAEVPIQQDQTAFGCGLLLLPLEEGDVGIAEAVDGLVLVAHDEEVAFTGHQADYPVLQGICVLELVYHHQSVAPGHAAADVLVGEQPPGRQGEVGEVEYALCPLDGLILLTERCQKPVEQLQSAAGGNEYELEQIEVHPILHRLELIPELPEVPCGPSLPDRRQTRFPLYPQGLVQFFQALQPLGDRLRLRVFPCHGRSAGVVNGGAEVQGRGFRVGLHIGKRQARFPALAAEGVIGAGDGLHQTAGEAGVVGVDQRQRSLTFLLHKALKRSLEGLVTHYPRLDLVSGPEIGIDAGSQGVGPEQGCTEAVDGADGGALDVTIGSLHPFQLPFVRITVDDLAPAQQVPDAFHHLGGGLPGEGDGQYLVDRSEAAADGVDVSSGDHSGLARAGSGGDEQGAVQGGDGPALGFGGSEPFHLSRLPRRRSRAGPGGGRCRRSRRTGSPCSHRGVRR